MSEGYRIQSGYDQPFGNLIDIETISVSGELFPGPKAIATYDQGNIKFRLNRRTFLQGDPNVTWQFGFMFYEQFSYLNSTYCAGTFSGLVTIYTTTGGVSFSRLNAIMILPKQVELSSVIWYKDVKVHFLTQGAAA